MKRGKEPIDFASNRMRIFSRLGQRIKASGWLWVRGGNENVAENARKKLTAKNADLIVANDVTAEGAGFDVDTNIVTLFSRDGRDVALPKLPKAEVAQRILDEIVRLRGVLRAQNSSAVSKPTVHRSSHCHL